MQPHYNLLYREEERDMLPLCADQGVGVLPWSPLARGRLARPWGEGGTKRTDADPFGKTLYSRTEEADKAVVDRLGEVAKARGVSQAQVALAWMMQKPAIAGPIVGATKAHHLEDAAAAVTLKLSADEMKALEEPYVAHPVLGLS
jgi:aryl-alcohol dehydrogenase-like predicted oxidoreductase